MLFRSCSTRGIAACSGRVAVSAAIVVLVAMAFAAASPLAAQPRMPEPTANDAEQAAARHRAEYDSSLKRARNPRFEEDVRGRDAWYNYQRSFPYDVVPAGARAAAVRRTREMEAELSESRAKGEPQATLLAANRWESIGPTNVGGRVPALAQHPGKAGVLLIGTASGGVWKSTDDGANWAPTFDRQDVLSVGALAFDYTDPNVVYAGTGEPTPHSEEYSGYGMYKSTDEGETWRNVGLTNVGGFSELYVHRQNHLIVYAGAAKGGGGFYRSINGGEQWSQTMSATVYDLSVNDANSNQLFIATSNGVFYSRDGGLTFERRTTGINTSSATRISVAWAPTLRSRVYALVASSNGFGVPNSADLYISNDTGRTWTAQHDFGGQFFNEQGYYNNILLVHPDTADIVLAAGIDVYRSDNAGVNFANFTDSYAHIDEPNGVHPDQHVLEFDPRNHNRLLLGNDGGLFRSEQAGIDWTRVTLDMPITQFYRMDVDFSDVSRVYGGAQDNGSSGSFGGNTDRKKWGKLSGGDGFYVAADPIQTGIVYTEIYYGTPIFRVNTANTNDIHVIDDFVSQVSGGEKGDWSSPLVASLADGALYSGRRNLWRTRDGGNTWDRLTPGTGGLMSAVGLSPFGDKVIVGTNSGDLRFSTNDGANWTTSRGVARRVISDLRYDFIDEHRVYATVSGYGAGHVYRSDDDGANFVDITGNLPDVPVNTIAVDAVDNQRLYVGTDAGAFVSLVGGKVWFPFNDGLPPVPVVDLKIHDASRTLVAATHGRSMYKVNIASVSAQPYVVRPANRTAYETPGRLPVAWAGFTGPVRVYISYDAGATWNLMADGVGADTVSLQLPTVRSTDARIKVEQIGGGEARSGTFTLAPKANGNEQASRGFVAEAIEYRRGYLWATVRGNDSMYRMKLPLLSNREGLRRTGIPGRVRDLAYDSTADRFYVLVTENDLTLPRLYLMDTAGVALGEIPLPGLVDRAAGIAFAPEGLAVTVPGAVPKVVLLDTAGSVLRSTSAVAQGFAPDRRSLAWDGRGLVQGVMVADPTDPFTSLLQTVRLEDTLRVRESIPALLASGKQIEFFGLAHDYSNAGAPLFWATDTAGAIYKLSIAFSGVDTRTAAVAGLGTTLRAIDPNPARDAATVRIGARDAGVVTLDLYSADGRLVAHLFNGRLEPGETALRADLTGVPSGLYHVILSGNGGGHDARTIVVVR